MPNFTNLTFELNTGTLASPAWLAVTSEVRWSDQGTQTATGSAAWPSMVQPSSPTVVAYSYCFTSDATGFGVPGGGAPIAFSNANYLFCRWNWDASGTFASAPIVTSYYSTAHAAVVRGDGQLLGGAAGDTGATPRSYLKANWFGNGTSQVPAAAPAAAPAITDGATGPATTASNSWLAAYQGLQGDNDFIACTATPPARTANQWYGMLALFAGPNLSPTTYTPVVTLKYTWA
jgi:hypothetical protein